MSFSPAKDRPTKRSAGEDEMNAVEGPDKRAYLGPLSLLHPHRGLMGSPLALAYPLNSSIACVIVCLAQASISAPMWPFAR